MSIVVVAVATPKPGHEDAALAAIQAVVPAVHAEDGCEKYALHRSPDGDALVMVERWASWDALAAHQRGEPLARLVADLDGKLAAPLQVQRVEPVIAGVEEKGHL